MENKEQSKKYRTLKMSFEDDWQKEIKEIVLKSEYADGISLNDLMNTFRQFILSLGYSDDTAKLIRNLDEQDLDNLGVDIEELNITEIA